MDKSHLMFLVVVLMLQAQPSLSDDLEETIIAMQHALIVLKLPHNVKVYNIANDNVQIQLIANGIGAESTRNSELQLGNLKLLPEQTGAARQPPQWNVQVLVYGIWTVGVLSRSDNLYIVAYWSRHANCWRELKSKFLDSHSESINLGVTYQELYGERSDLSKLALSQSSLGEAVRTLETTTDLVEVGRAITVMVVMLSETQRFTGIRDCVLQGWDEEDDGGCHLTDKDIDFLTEFAPMSCYLLEGPEFYGDEVYATLRDLMVKHSLSSQDLPGMLVVLIRGDFCKGSINMATPINPPEILAP